MNLKRIIAGVAVATTLLAGLSLGVASASAADTIKDFDNNGTITLTGEGVKGRTFKAVQVGTYTLATIDGDKATSVAVGTVPGLKAALDTTVKSSSLSTNYMASAYGKSDNPAGFVANSFFSANDTTVVPKWSGLLRDFVTNLVDTQDFKTAVAAQGVPSVTAGANDMAVTFNSLPQGIYVVVDTSDVANSGHFGPSAPMFVPTTIAGKAMLNDHPVGTINVKNELNAKPTKTADKANANVGDTITYTVESTLPSMTGRKSFSYSFTDMPGLGLTAKTGTVKVYVADEHGNYADALATGVTVTPANADVVGKADGSAKFVTMIADVINYPGRKIKMVYQAMVNNEIATVSGGLLINTATVNPNGEGESEPDTSKVKTFEFQFTKTDASGTALDGAKFTVMNKTDGKYRMADGTPSDTMTELTGDNGVFMLKGLKAGMYTVTETAVPTGFMAGAKATFTVTIADDGTATYTENDVFGLVSGDADDIKVKNVRAITELPLTGGAGIALFSVVGLLLAGAGAAVYVRSRATRRALSA